MKLYKITDLTLFEPIMAHATDHDDVARLFEAGVARAFGKVPDIEYWVSRWKLENTPMPSSLCDIVARRRRGFVFEGRHKKWDLFDPFSG